MVAPLWFLPLVSFSYGCSFCTERLPGGDPLGGAHGPRSLVLDEKICSCQVTGSGKRLSPEGFVLRISGIEEIVVLDSIIARGHSLHRADRQFAQMPGTGEPPIQR